MSNFLTDCFSAVAIVFAAGIDVDVFIRRFCHRSLSDVACCDNNRYTTAERFIIRQAASEWTLNCSSSAPGNRWPTDRSATDNAIAATIATANEGTSSRPVRYHRYCCCYAYTLLKFNNSGSPLRAHDADGLSGS